MTLTIASTKAASSKLSDSYPRLIDDKSGVSSPPAGVATGGLEFSAGAAAPSAGRSSETIPVVAATPTRNCRRYT